MCRRIFITTISIILMQASVHAQVFYNEKEQLISIKAESELLSRILSEISHKTGITVYINPAVDKNIFINIQNLSIERALKIITRPFNRVFIFDGDSIIAIKIFEHSDEDASTKLIHDQQAPKTLSKATAQEADESLTSEENNMQIIEKEGYKDMIEFEEHYGGN